MSSLKIKICGLREPNNFHEVLELQPDYLGFIFYPASPRYIGMKRSELRVCIQQVPQAKRTGVFVNAGYEQILSQVEYLGLSNIQLHGSESPEFCQALKAIGLQVWKAVGVDEATDWASLAAYRGKIDYFLFDTKSSQYGGTGVSFNWNQLQNYQGETPYILSGGIGPDSVDALLDLRKADKRLHGIDLNSRFEIKPGHKDVEQLKNFIHKLHLEDEKLSR